MTKLFIGTVVFLLAGSVGAHGVNPATEIAEEQAPVQVGREAHDRRLEALIVSLADEMRVIRIATNRSEREALMIEHRERLRAAITRLRELGGDRMNAVLAAHESPADEKTGAETSDPRRHLYQLQGRARLRNQMSDVRRLADLENRLDMLQIVVQSLLDEYANDEADGTAHKPTDDQTVALATPQQ